MGAKFAKAGGEPAGLMAGAADEYAKVGESEPSPPATRAWAGTDARPFSVSASLSGHGCWGTATPWL
ncbi:MAG TPA: hypothetical protein VEI52_08385 [Terriglobales bacterium]|nr:hypothetical protein [Terriglobales bacterium]